MAKVSPIYALRSGEKIGPGFVRVLEQISNRVGKLARHPDGADEAMHEVRLLIKRVRALLWFAKPALARGARRQAKLDLRKASRLLSAPRDLAVAHATLSQLASEMSGSKNRKALAQASNRLKRKRAAQPEPPVTEHELLRGAAGLLLNALMLIRKNAGGVRLWPSVKDRLVKAFHAEHRARKKVVRTGGDIDFHQWRKKAKRLLYNLQLIHSTPDKKIARTMKTIDFLQEQLGIYHDCVMAEESLRSDRPTLWLHRTFKVLKRKKAQLRMKAWKLSMKSGVL